MLGVNVGDVIAYLRLNTSQFDIALATSQQRMQSFAASLGKMGSYLTWRVTLPLALFGRKATKAFAEFDDALTRSAAVTKGMTAEIRKQMAQTAIDLSKKSLFSATQLAEGYFALGQAGYHGAQSMKALPVVEQFATASATSLDESIRYLVRTVNGLGMASEDAVKNMEALVKISNSFTYAAITTTAEVEDFAIAMTHAAAPALKLVNKGIQEGSAALMAFALAGIQAEEAGTLLWTTIRDLQRASIKARTEWKNYDLTIFDTAGKMRNIEDIFADLENRFGTMSDEGKKVTLMLLGFQDRSLRGIQALMGFSDAMKFFRKQMEEGGNVTERVAEAYKKSFHANLVMAKHAVEAFSISLGRTLAPIMMKLTEYVKRFVFWWESLTDHTKLVIVEIGIATVVMGPLLLILSRMVTTLAILSISWKVLGLSVVGIAKSFGMIALGILGALGPIALVIAALYTIRAVWNQATGRIKENLDSMVEAFQNAFEFIANSLIGEFAKNMVLTFAESFSIIRSNWKTFIADLIGLTKGAIEWTKGFAEAIEQGWSAPTFHSLIERIKRGTAEANKAFAESFVTGWEDNLSKIEEYTHEAFEVTTVYTKSFVEAALENLGDLGAAIKKQFGKDIAFVGNLLVGKLKGLNKQFLGLLPSEMEQTIINFIEMVRTSKDDLLSMLDSSIPAIEQLRKTLKDMRKDLEEEYQLIHKTAKERERLNIELNIYRMFVEQLGDAIHWTTEEHEAYNKELKKHLDVLDEIIEKREGFGAFFESSRQWAEDAKNIWANLGDDLAKGLDSFADTFADFLIKGKADWRSFAASLVQDWLKTMIKMQMATYWKAIATNVLGIPATPVVATKSSYGAAFQQGRLIPMAMGDIVGTPSLIPMAQGRTALIGEAGPEAVMPLTRIGGKLGVQATGQGVVVNVINQSGTSLQVSRQETYMMSDQRIVDVVVRQAETDNHLRRAMRINR